MSHIKPSKLTVDAGHVKLKGTENFAVGIMLGVVTECALIEDTVVGPALSPYTVHKVSIIPFTQEMRRDTSVWGRLFNFNVIVGAISDMGISFSTRKKMEAPTASPKKTAIFKSVATSALYSAPSTSSPASLTSYPVSKAFTDPSMFQMYQSASVLTFSTSVPIYDGREVGDHQPFRFTDDDFKNLHTWCLYKRGRHNLHNRSVVAVGYTVGTYTTQKNSSPSLSTNVQFMMLLGKTTVDG
jgi:hypothetical protein